MPIVLLSTSSGGSLSPRRYNSEPWSIVAAQEDRDDPIGFDISVVHLSKMFNTVFAQLLKKFTAGKGSPIKEITT